MVLWENEAFWRISFFTICVIELNFVMVLAEMYGQINPGSIRLAGFLCNFQDLKNCWRHKTDDVSKCKSDIFPHQFISQRCQATAGKIFFSFFSWGYSFWILRWHQKRKTGFSERTGNIIGHIHGIELLVIRELSLNISLSSCKKSMESALLGLTGAAF